MLMIEHLLLCKTKNPDIFGGHEPPMLMGNKARDICKKN